MFVSDRGSLRGLARWQARALIFFSLIAASVVLGHEFFELGRYLGLPPLPLTVVGGAIGIFVSFRTNSAYDRWWEGRKLWGSLVNRSRHFRTELLVYVGPKRPELAAEMVRRHIAYVHCLRCLLRREDPLEDARFLGQISAEEAESYRGETNMTHAILQRQAELLVGLAEEGVIDEFRLQSLDGTISSLLDIQGGCERIKNTPFPRGYTFISTRLVRLYAFLLPLGMVQQISWLALPMTVLVCIALELISEAGRVLEDPFTTFWPALPLSALSTTIERNLRQRLGDEELPEPEPVRPPGVLM